jgi:hypothetical protein
MIAVSPWDSAAHRPSALSSSFVRNYNRKGVPLVVLHCQPPYDDCTVCRRSTILVHHVKEEEQKSDHRSRRRLVTVRQVT